MSLVPHQLLRSSARPLTVLGLALVGLLLLAAAHLELWARAHPGESLIHGHDDRRYYATARSLVVDGDLDFANELERLDPAQPEALTPAGRTANKYGVGMPLLTLPAMLPASAMGASGEDGFGLGLERVFRHANTVLGLAGIAIVALAAGALAGRWIGVAAALLLVPGSPLLWYVVIQPTMAHAAATLCLGVAVAGFVGRYVLGRGEWRFVLAMGLGVGWAASVRMQDAPVGLLFVLGEASRAMDSVRRDGTRPAMLAAVLAGCVFGVSALAGLLPQLIYQKLVWGAWLTNAYAAGGEGFHWAQPALGGLLLSTRNSLFFYHPALALGVLGLVWEAWRGEPAQKRAAVTFLALLAVNIYINSVWHLWTMGSSFGARGLLNSWPLLVGGLALLMRRAAASWRLGYRLPMVLLGGALAASIAWSVLLMLLYYNHTIPHDGSGFDPAIIPGALREAGARVVEKVGRLGG